ncbi:hypothetical protein [Paenibacillus tundrae]
MSDELKSVDDILNHYKKQETYKRSAEIVKRFGWGGEIKLVEVKKDEGSEVKGQTADKPYRSQNVPTISEDSEGERDIKQQSATSVPEKLRKGS